MNLKQYQRKKEIQEMAEEAAKRSVTEIMGEVSMFKVGGLKSVSRHVDIKYEVVDLLEDYNVPESVISQIVHLMTELKTLAENQKPDYLTERRKVK